jgi:hypothetical protein
VPDSPEARNGFPPLADAAAESTVELSDTNQSWESAAVEGSEDAADHAERTAHTHEEYGRPTMCHRKLRGIHSQASRLGPLPKRRRKAPAGCTNARLAV